jgi:hypothetical protein
VASAAFQIGIVPASATFITGMLALTWLAMGLSGLDLMFMIMAPHGQTFVQPAELCNCSSSKK